MFKPYIPPTTEEGKRAERIGAIERHFAGERWLSGYAALLEALDLRPGSPDLLALARNWQQRSRSRAMDLASDKATEMANVTYKTEALERLLKRLEAQ